MKIQANFRFYIIIALHLWSGGRHYMSMRGIDICIVWPLTHFAVMTILTLDVCWMIVAMEVYFCLERIVSLNGCRKVYDSLSRFVAFPFTTFLMRLIRNGCSLSYFSCRKVLDH